MKFIKDLENKYLSSSTKERVALDKKYLAYLEEKLKTDPNDVPSLIHCGVLYWEPFHDHIKAAMYLKKAIVIDPKNVDARYWLSTMYYHDCWYKEAEKILVEALEIDPKRADCLNRMATLIWDYYKDLPRAIHYAQQAVHFAPDCPSFVRFLEMLQEKARNIQAVKLYSQKLEELSKIPPVKIRNGIEYYYEMIVTGRGRNKNE